MIEIIIYKNYYCNYIFIYFILLREKERGVTDDVTALVCSRDVRCFFSLSDVTTGSLNSVRG